MQNTQPFTLAINYWPRQRSGTAHLPNSWMLADLGAVRAELAHIAELGCSRVDFTLRWAEAQPGPNRLNMAALNNLERALDAAADANLTASLAVLEGTFGGALHLPLWAVGYRMIGDLLRARRFGPVALPSADELPPILTDDRYRHEPVGDLYNSPYLRAATRYFINEVVGGLAGHPALTEWQLGGGLTRVRKHQAAQAAHAWWQELVAEAGHRGARTVTGTIEAADLLRANGLRPEAIAASGALVGLRALPLPPASERKAAAANQIRFLHALTAGLIRAAQGQTAPIHVRDLGVPMAAEGQSGWVPTELYGYPTTIWLADSAEQAHIVEATLHGLYQDGAAGVTLLAYADQPASLWSVPPLDQAWIGRTGGLIDAQGREKPVASVVRSWAAQLRAGRLPTPHGPPALPIDPERYWYNPEIALQRLAADFLNR